MLSNSAGDRQTSLSWEAEIDTNLHHILLTAIRRRNACTLCSDAARLYAELRDSNPLHAGCYPSALPAELSHQVEMAGIEPATATLAGRARSLAVTPTGRLPRSRFGLPLWCSRLWRCQEPSLCERLAGTAGVEPAFCRFWEPAAYPLANP